MAVINIRLNKNFTTQFNKMQEKYGEEFAKLNGFADEQLSYTDFIQNFIDTETVADVSVDGNANVGNKDMRTLMNEMPKSHRKLLAYNKIYYELNKKYGSSYYYSDDVNKCKVVSKTFYRTKKAIK